MDGLADQEALDEVGGVDGELIGVVEATELVQDGLSPGKLLAIGVLVGLEVVECLFRNIEILLELGSDGDDVSVNLAWVILDLIFLDLILALSLGAAKAEDGFATLFTYIYTVRFHSSLFVEANDQIIAFQKAASKIDLLTCNQMVVG